MGILSIVAPIFLVMAAGNIAIRRKLIPQDAIPAIGQFVMYFALPALIIRAMTRADTSLGERIEPEFIAAYGGGAFLTWLLAFVAFRLFMRNEPALAGIKCFGSSFSNSAFVGYPLLSMAYDEPPITIFAMALLFENVVLMPLVLISQEWIARDRALDGRAMLSSIATRIVTNPIIITIAVGLMLAVFEWQLPDVIANTLDLLGRASAGAALFFIGASLAGRQVGEHRSDALQVAFFKLLVHPALVMLLLLLFPGLSTEYKQAALLLAACPMLTIYPIISGQYGYTGMASATLLITTAISMFTITAVLMLAFSQTPM